MGQKYGKMVDIWAIGCTLYEMMHHEHAFQGSDSGQILQNIVWARHAQIDPRWSARLVAVLRWMLKLKPDERPEASTIIKDPMFTPLLHGGALHPKALRHQEELAHLAESPTGVQEVQLDSARARATSAAAAMAHSAPVLHAAF